MVLQIYVRVPQYGRLWSTVTDCGRLWLLSPGELRSATEKKNSDLLDQNLGVSMKVAGASSWFPTGAPPSSYNVRSELAEILPTVVVVVVVVNPSNRIESRGKSYTSCSAKHRRSRRSRPPSFAPF